MSETVLKPVFSQAGGRAVGSRPFVITFSGIDGAGKTTQIDRISTYLEKQGLSVLRLSFWEDVAVWSKLRAGIAYRAATDLGHAGEPPFAPKNHKHARKWYLTAARSGLYLLDVAQLHRLLAAPHVRNHDVLIFDRYVYDQVANICSQSWAARTHSELLLKWTPTPDLGFVLDALPSAAFARKPEYPLDFMHRNRREFLQLQKLHPHLILISDAGVEEVQDQICSHVRRSNLRGRTSPAANDRENQENPLVHSQSFCTVESEPAGRV